MGLETAAVDHACNVVRREIQEEFPQLTLLYIVHQDGQRAKALEARRSELLEHPAGEAFLPYLQNRPKKAALSFPEYALSAKRNSSSSWPRIKSSPASS
jgi:hypothetical protein